MKRREFLALIGSGAMTWPNAALSQQTTRIPLIGVLSGAREDDALIQARLAAFRKVLQELGWTVGRNVRFEVRYSNGEPVRLRAAVSELVKLAPDVILAHGTAAIAELKPATNSIPIVFVIVNDPVAQGYVQSVARPGGNITGFSFMDYSMIGKALGLLKQVAPTVTRIGFMFNPTDYPYYEVYLRALGEQRQSLSLDVEPMRLHNGSEIEAAVAAFAGKAGGGILAPPSTFSFVNHRAIIEQTAQHRLPAVLPFREAVAEGALMSYAPDQAEIFQRAAPYVDRILKGANPGDLPVQAPTKFEFVINLKTARTLGLSIPLTLLAIADEVIE